MKYFDKGATLLARIPATFLSPQSQYSAMSHRSALSPCLLARCAPAPFFLFACLRPLACDRFRRSCSSLPKSLAIFRAILPIICGLGAFERLIPLPDAGRLLSQSLLTPLIIYTVTEHGSPPFPSGTLPCKGTPLAQS